MHFFGLKITFFQTWFTDKKQQKKGMWQQLFSRRKRWRLIMHFFMLIRLCIFFACLFSKNMWETQYWESERYINCRFPSEKAASALWTLRILMQKCSQFSSWFLRKWADLELDFLMRVSKEVLRLVLLRQQCVPWKNATTMNFIATFSTPCPIMVAIIVM